MIAYMLRIAVSLHLWYVWAWLLVGIVLWPILATINTHQLAKPHDTTRLWIRREWERDPLRFFGRFWLLMICWPLSFVFTIWG